MLSRQAQFRKFLLGTFLLVILCGQAAIGDEASYTPSQQATALPLAPAIDIPNAKQVFPGILSGGQPSEAQFQEARQKGYKTIINLRPAAEQGDFNEAQYVKALGLNYINIPVAGADDLTTANNQALHQALSNAGNYPVLLHCASGNRVGALFALDARQRAQLPADRALAIGKQNGLTHLEETVKTLLK